MSPHEKGDAKLMKRCPNTTDITVCGGGPFGPYQCIHAYPVFTQ